MMWTVIALLGALTRVRASDHFELTISSCNASETGQTGWATHAEAGSGVSSLRHGEHQCLDCGACTPGSLVSLVACPPTLTSAQLFNITEVRPHGSKLPLHQITSAKVPSACMRLPGTGYTLLSYVTMDWCANPIPESISPAYATRKSWAFDAGSIINAGRGCCGDIFEKKPRCLQANYGPLPSCKEKELKGLAYCDQSLDAVTRAADLVSHMTLDEKALNMDSNNPGSIRLGVKPNRFSESLHTVRAGCGKTHKFPGYVSTGCPTSFPQVITLGATWNRTLWSKVASAISTEARALTNQVGMGFPAGLFLWAPNINPFRDPRWGRGQEVPSEDPFMCGEYAMHYIRALQEGTDSRYLKAVATAKHFADYDQEGNFGTDRQKFSANVSLRDQAEYYLPSFRAAVQGGHARSIMCAYNAINGVPSCGSPLLLQTTLKEEWGFDGFIVSDCDAVNDGAFDKYIDDHFNGSKLEQARVAIQAGTDVDCGALYGEQVAEAVRKGVLPESDVNAALKRVYRHAMMLGLFDDSVSYEKLGPESVGTPESLQLALEAAQQALVLLKNDNGALPLRSEPANWQNGGVVLIGPHANGSYDLLGNRNYRGENLLVEQHTPLLAFQARLGHQVQVSYSPGCDITSDDTSAIADAVAAAKRAQLAVLFVGLNGEVEDEGRDRNQISLPGVQEKLIEAVSNTGVKTIVVLINGGGLAIDSLKASTKIPAIVEAFYPGDFGADAIANLVFGDISPSGRLPVTIYSADFVKGRDIEYMDLRGQGGITYKHFKGQPLWEFGFGLSYTTFKYAWHSSNNDPHDVTTDYVVAAREAGDYYHSQGRAFSGPSYQVNVTNTGERASPVVVLGFLTNAPGQDAPLKELFGYERVADLQVGETVTVTLTVPPQLLLRIDDQGHEWVHPGSFKVQIGGGPEDYASRVAGSLQVTGQPLRVGAKRHFVI